jgi:hypothetical protein
MPHRIFIDESVERHEFSSRLRRAVYLFFSQVYVVSVIGVIRLFCMGARLQ